MIQSLEEVLKRAEEVWEEDRKGKVPDSYTSQSKTSFMFGWLQSAYETAYKFVPKKWKEEPATNSKSNP